MVVPWTESPYLLLTLEHSHPQVDTNKQTNPIQLSVILVTLYNTGTFSSIVIVGMITFDVLITILPLVPKMVYSQ